MKEPKVAILVDGEWFSKVVMKAVNLSTRPNAGETYAMLVSVVEQNEQLLKILYYDSRPYSKSLKNPISHEMVDYSNSSAAIQRTKFLRELGQMNYIALRTEDVKVHGWKDYILKSWMKDKNNQPRLLKPEDICPDFEQKGIDMRIGIDVAMMAIRRQVDRLILVTGDTDMIPAMKLARREGIQIVLTKILRPLKPGQPSTTVNLEGQRSQSGGRVVALNTVRGISAAHVRLLDSVNIKSANDLANKNSAELVALGIPKRQADMMITNAKNAIEANW